MFEVKYILRWSLRGTWARQVAEAKGAALKRMESHCLSNMVPPFAQTLLLLV